MEQRDCSQYMLSIKNKVYNGTVTTAAASALCQRALMLAAESSCGMIKRGISGFHKRHFSQRMCLYLSVTELAPEFIVQPFFSLFE